MNSTVASKTPSSLAPTRRRSRTRLGLVAVALTAILGLSACMDTQQQTAFDLVNQSRAQSGMHALAHDYNAQVKAQAWAEHLAAENTLAHSRLSDGMGGYWKRVAENVGYGSSVDSVHRQFMASAGHRANILDRGLTHVGVGVARGHGRTFVVQVFSER